MQLALTARFLEAAIGKLAIAPPALAAVEQVDFVLSALAGFAQRSAPFGELVFDPALATLSQVELMAYFAEACYLASCSPGTWFPPYPLQLAYLETQTVFGSRPEMTFLVLYLSRSLAAAVRLSTHYLRSCFCFAASALPPLLEGPPPPFCCWPPAFRACSSLRRSTGISRTFNCPPNDGRSKDCASQMRPAWKMTEQVIKITKKRFSFSRNRNPAGLLSSGRKREGSRSTSRSTA